MRFMPTCGTPEHVVGTTLVKSWVHPSLLRCGGNQGLEGAVLFTSQDDVEKEGVSYTPS